MAGSRASARPGAPTTASGGPGTTRRIGVYVDGYNLYYGGRAHCGRGASGWRWLDIRAMAENVIASQGAWRSPNQTRIVYCTARVDGATNPSAHT